MSYILNALKKAERDRLREDPKELEDFASARWDPYQQQPSSNTLKYVLIIAALVALCLGLSAYLGIFSSSPQTAIDSIDAPLASAPNPTVDKTPEVDRVSIAESVAQPIRSAVPELAISGHMYFAEGSPSNRLFANGQSYKEADRVAEGWVLVTIGVEGIQIHSGERLEFLPYP